MEDRLLDVLMQTLTFAVLNLVHNFTLKSIQQYSFYEQEFFYEKQLFENVIFRK